MTRLVAEKGIQRPMTEAEEAQADLDEQRSAGKKEASKSLKTPLQRLADLVVQAINDPDEARRAAAIKKLEKFE